MEEEYNFDWNRPFSEIKRDMTLINVYDSLEFLEDFSKEDKEQLYRFAKIVENYLKMTNKL